MKHLGDADLLILRVRRNSRRAMALVINVMRVMTMRASVRPLLSCVAADGRPKIPIKGKYGKKDSKAGSPFISLITWPWWSYAR